MKPLLIILSLVAAISIALNVFFLHDRSSSKEATYKVLEVIDGDTFKINNNSEERRVRLIGVNAPETGKCLGIEAKDKLIKLVLGKDVSLKDQFSDPYGRIMANVFVGNQYVNSEMLLSGLGRMDYYENPHRDELKAAYEQARLKKLGVYSGICLSLTPPISPQTGIACTVKGNIDDNNQKKIYYLPDCNNYSQVIIDLSTDDQWFCSDGEAVRAGFEKSKTCD